MKKTTTATWWDSEWTFTAMLAAMCTKAVWCFDSVNLVLSQARVVPWISAYLSDISQRMSEHHWTLDKTELPFPPGKEIVHPWPLSISAYSRSTTTGGVCSLLGRRRSFLVPALVTSPLNCTSLLTGVNVSLDLCSSSRMQQPGWSLTSFPTPHRLSTRYTGLIRSDSRHWYLQTVLQAARTDLTSRTWSNLGSSEHVGSVVAGGVYLWTYRLAWGQLVSMLTSREISLAWYKDVFNITSKLLFLHILLVILFF